MNPAFVVWLIAVSIGAGALGGALGMASGIFIVPILTMFGHLEIHAAIIVSIVSVIACSCGSAAPFLKNGMTNIRLAIVLEVATTLGALTGLLLIGVLPVSLLYLLFSIVLLASAWQMNTRRADIFTGVEDSNPRDCASRLRLHSSYSDTHLHKEIVYRVQRLPLGLALMYGAGVLSALLGIGSGVLKIPAMDTALRLPIKVSGATSNFMIGVTAAASGVAYYIRGDIDAAVAGPVALGSVIGSLIGGRLLISVSGAKLRLLFVIVLIVLAMQMALSALGIHLWDKPS
jgi:uncharacterized protein